MNRHTRPAPTATAGLLVITCILPVLLAGNDAPRSPARDFHAMPACTVIRVINAETLVVRVKEEGRYVALMGVKAPPLSQPFGHDARRYLETLLKGEQVYVDFPAKPSYPDSFGRTPAMLYRVPDGLCINLEVIRQGWADVAARRTNSDVAGLTDEQAAAFEFFAKRAKESGKGRWAEPAANADVAGGNAAGATDRDAAEPPAPDSPDASAPSSAPAQPGPSAKRAARATTAPTTSPSGPAPSTNASNGTEKPASADETTVYITASGKKYHNPDCPHLRKSARAITLKEAKSRGYTPCATCKPPE